MKHLVFGQPNIALESIAFQDRAYFDALTEVVKNVRNKSINLLAACNQIDVLTMKYKGINVKTHTEPDMVNGWITVNWLTATNPIMDKSYLKYSTYMDYMKDRDITEIQGTIDDKKAKVGGVFSEMEHTMCIGDPFMIDADLCSPEAAAGVILHEVGHAYTFLQMCMGMMIINVAIQQASANLAKAKDHNEVIMVFKRAAKDMKIENGDFINEVVTSDNRVAQLEYLSTRGIQESGWLMMGDVSKGYSQNAAEELADIFAARHGAEKAVMEVRKLYSTDTYDIMSGLSIKAAKLLIMGGLAVSFLPPVATLLLTVLAIPSILSLYRHATIGKNYRGHTTGIVQVRKMQNQLIERLKEKQSKNPAVTAELVGYVQDGIAYGDSILAEIKKNESVYFELASLFIASLRDARKMRQYHDRLEGLAANRLFLASAKFIPRKA